MTKQKQTDQTEQTLDRLRIAYGTPTYRSYEDSALQWLEWKRQAATCTVVELTRHASVSTSNRHSCRQCFCCAALAVLQEVRGKG